MAIWKNSLNLIYKRPLLGYGAGLFPLIYLNMKEEYIAQHSHNLILQIAFDYGFPIALLLTIFSVLSLSISSTKLSSF